MNSENYANRSLLCCHWKAIEMMSGSVFYGGLNGIENVPVLASWHGFVPCFEGGRL